MSFATLERAIVAAARLILNNPKLRLADIQEWSTGKLEGGASVGEVIVRVPDPGVWILVKLACDKRAKK